MEKGFEYSDTWFGESFTAWTHWYLGVGFYTAMTAAMAAAARAPVEKAA